MFGPQQGCWRCQRLRWVRGRRKCSAVAIRRKPPTTRSRRAALLRSGTEHLEAVGCQSADLLHADDGAGRRRTNAPSRAPRWWLTRAACAITASRLTHRASSTFHTTWSRLCPRAAICAGLLPWTRGAWRSAASNSPPRPPPCLRKRMAVASPPRRKSPSRRKVTMCRSTRRPRRGINPVSSAPPEQPPRGALCPVWGRI